MAGKQVSQIRQCFFQTVFRLLGYVAKCDGHISSAEIRRTGIFMEKLGLTPQCKLEAKELFHKGAAADFDFRETLHNFRRLADKNPEIVQILLVYLISMATTDGPLLKEEMKVIQHVATELGYSSLLFDHLLKMIAAQDAFAKRDEQKEDTNRGHSPPGKDGREDKPRLDPQLAAALSVLGLTEYASDQEILRSYRRLVNQFHPDKLLDKGLPPELLAAATERFRAIRDAYEYLRKNRFRSGAA